jgi:hypothetical protein
MLKQGLRKSWGVLSALELFDCSMEIETFLHIG